MNSIDYVNYHSQEEYQKAKSYLEKFTAHALHWSATQSQEDLREEIIGNFIARGTVCLDSIFRLWQVENHHDCWILQRALFDRYVHLKHLGEKNEFNEFERWSFQMRFKDSDVALSDPHIVKKLTPDELKKARGIHKERRKRYDKEPKRAWKRPRSEDVTKQSNLLLLHRIGYNFTSSLVHPMADDGVLDFYRLLGWTHPISGDTLGWAYEIYGDTRIILHNSMAYLILLVKTGLESSNLSWENFVFDFYGALVLFLENGNSDYVSNCQDAFALGPHHPWCKSRK